MFLRMAFRKKDVLKWQGWYDEEEDDGDGSDGDDDDDDIEEGRCSVLWGRILWFVLHYKYNFFFRYQSSYLTI